MADSNITKQALAASLQELMREIPFEKISVAHICGKCGMNRKSFYYHFKDKYDLVNWIFDKNFIDFATAMTADEADDDRWELIERACEHFYEERDFYRKAFLIKGQNSFSEHFREYILPLLKKRLVCLVGDDGADDFTVNFFSDAIVCSMERWLLDQNCMPPKQFVAKIKGLVQNGAAAIYRETAF
ncbi:MAG: TetR/AcrR family transcriptional regulator C-terminal domain-containing protein [Lachnospiraceae bacterium]|nr:TetR/AcrR family transcriptional regulator C-terminal domain-containing protein [Lachnospiraceae bacterium]